MKVFLDNKNGSVKINVNGIDYPPLAFKSFRPTEKNISDFYKAGVKFFCVLSTGMESATKDIYYSNFGESWIDDYSYDFKPIDDQIELFLKYAPNAYLDIMLQIDTRKWWLEKYPEYPNSFWCLSQMCADEKWRKAACAYLKAAVAHIEEKYGEKVFAYHILGGTTTEWLSDGDKEDASEMKVKAYKEYLNDDEAVIPTKEERELPIEQVFLDPTKDANLISYRKFHAEVIADTILYLAKGIREIIGYDKLLGVYYGYIFELGGPRLWNAGHLAYEKIFNSKEIDLIAGPSPYSWWRRCEGTSGVMCTVDTLTLNNKLYFQEQDHRTHLPMKQFPSDKVLVGGSGAKKRQETIDMIRREFMYTQSKGLALWWFDMFEGWYYEDELMAEIKKCTELAERLAAFPNKNVAEIAVITDPEAMYYLNKNAHVNSELLTWERAELSNIGAPYDLFSACSLDKIDFSRYKLVIFLAQVKANEKYTQIINEKIKKDGRTVMWIYAPHYVSDSLSVDGISEIVDMKVQRLCQAESIVKCNELRFGFTYSKDTMFFVRVDGDDSFCSTEPNVEILGRYQISLAPALVRKNCGDYYSVFCGSGYVTADIFRKIAEEAGVHIYTKDTANAVYVNENMLGVYHRECKDAEINVIHDGVYRDVYSDKEYIAVDGILKLPYTETTKSKLFIKHI